MDIRILLVEDYPTNQLVAMQYLQKAGYKVDLAETGQQAIDMYEKSHHDLVFMDLQLPVMDGFEATKGIRTHESGLTDKGPQSLARCSIIAMTAHATVEIRNKCLCIGMDDFISKPVRRIALLAMVEKWVNKIANSKPSADTEKANTQDTGPEEMADDKLPISVDSAESLKSEDKAKTDDQARSDGPIDLDKGIKEFEGDKDFFMEVAKGFLENVRNQTKKIKQAITDGDSETVRNEAHSIKGGAANLTANNLSSVADKLEIIGKSGNLENGDEVFEGLLKEFQYLEDFVNKLNI